MPRYYRNKLFPVSNGYKSSITRVFVGDDYSQHLRMSLKRQELQYSIEEKRFKNYLFKNNLLDNDESRLRYEEYKKTLRKDCWRKAYKIQSIIYQKVNYE